MEGDGPGVVEEAAHPAEELGVGEVAATNPGQVFDVLLRVLVEESQVLGKSLRTGKVVHMKERVWRSECFVILWPGSHDDGEDLGKHNPLYSSRQDTCKLTLCFKACQNFSEM